MNWVGGWRSRVMKGSDTRKQKEFFEKKRMQNRHNLVAPPSSSPKKGHVGNLDLLTMFIVNQIALKKEDAVNPKITHLAKSKELDKSLGGESLQLPMSPCSPSRLSLAESETHHSDQTQGLEKRKHSLLDEFKFRVLSPLVESNLSDNSALQCHPRLQGSVGSLSSASPSSSEAFNFPSRPTVHISPLPATESHCTETSKPIRVYEYNHWKMPYQTEALPTDFSDGVQFGSTLHCGPSVHFAENPFTDLETNDQEEKPYFFGLNSGGEGRVRRIVSEHVCESPVTCSQGKSYIISDNVTNSIASLRHILEGEKQAGGSYRHVFHSKDVLNTSQSSQSKLSAPAKVMSFNQNVMCKHEHRGKKVKAGGCSHTLGWIDHKQDCEKDQFVPSCLQTNTQSGKMNIKASSRTKDNVTQTVGFSSLTSQDASVQCCLLKPTRKSIFTKTHIYHSRTHKRPATKRQTCTSSKDHGNQFAPKIHKVAWNTSRLTSKREHTEQDPKAVTGHESLSKSASQTCMKKHPVLHCFHANAPEVEEQSSENMVLREERQKGSEKESVNQNPTVNSSCTEEQIDTFIVETGRDKVSEGKGNLKEIADILLMLMQKNEHP